MSGILRKRPPSNGGTEPASSSSKKQRFIDTFKTLLDISKESSDILPPLKSCLGGITALIKHYEEYNDVKEKIGDLIPWVEKLEATLVKTNLNDDPDEVERRARLGRDLEDIGNRSLVLSEKGKIARALDKMRDSGDVIKLIEKLRQAILVYQVSQQQSIYNQLTQLTSSFDAILKLRQGSPVEKKIEFVRARLDHFRAEEGGFKNADELRRHKNLFEALEGIKDRLELLSQQTGTEDNEDKGTSIAAISDIAEELRDVILDYQFSQQKAIYSQNCTLIDAAESMILNSCRQAQGAEFRHGDRRGCLKGTREAVLDEIEAWSKDHKSSPVYWLNGLAGTGKSTIAQTIAERLFADGKLGASFFCSRDFEDRRDLHYIFPTLAIQLAHSYPEFRTIFIPFIRSQPGIVHESLYNQMESLIVRPLSTLDITMVIIIDALDECVDEEPQSAILSVMGRLVEGIPGVKFLITGRPEPRINSGFRLGLLRPLTDVFVLHEVDPVVVDMDIRLYLEQGLHEIGKRQGMDQDSWPTQKHLDLLCERAGGLFVYAVATLKFLDHSFTPSSDQLDLITRAPGTTSHEGQANLKHGATLNSLYLSTFKAAFSGTSAEDDEKVRSVIGAVVLSRNPLSPSAIATLVNLGKQQVMNLLQLVQSLLKLSEDPDFPVLPFHKSFPDFITDPLRCPDSRFHVSPKTGHLKLALNCLKLMNDGLCFNLLSLPSYALNSEVEDLRGRIDDVVGKALSYACRSWCNHLTEVREDFVVVIPLLRSFLQERFLGWLEVLSVSKIANDAVTALEKLVTWLQEVAKDHQLLLTVRDYFQFAANFSEVINVSATHIYHSALELSPPTSIVRRLYYHQQLNPSPKVVIGIQDSWEPTIAIPGKNSKYVSSTWSPCGQFIAVMSEEAVEIWDALTLKPLSTPQSTKDATRFVGGLAYSPDGHSLAGGSDSAIIIWDTQTGGEVTRIELRVACYGLELMWSNNGETILTVSPYNSSTNPFTIHTYSVASGAILLLATLGSRDKPHIWACDKSFQILVTTQDEKSKTFDIFEAGSTLTKVESFPFQLNFYLEAFSPTTFHATLAPHGKFSHSAGELHVLDIRTSEVLLREKRSCRSATFSPDAKFLAVSGIGSSLSIWEYTSGHYVKQREFQQSEASLQFSPTSLSILGTSLLNLYILHLDYFPSAVAIRPATTVHHQLVDAFSPNSTYIVTAYQGESTITITNLQPQIPFPLQFIDTELEISTMGLIGNVLMVKSPDKIVTWLLTEKGVVDGIIGNTRADYNDHLWELSISGLATALAKLLRVPSVDHDTLGFSVMDNTAIIGLHGFDVCIYHTGTGEIIKGSNITHPYTCKFYRFYDTKHHVEGCNLYHNNQCIEQGTINKDWLISPTTSREGWIRDPEGRHRLWLPPRWRTNDVNWLCSGTVLRLKKHSQLVIVKF